MEGLGTGENVISVILVIVDHHSESVVLLVGDSVGVGKPVGIGVVSVGMGVKVHVEVSVDV